jgi:hypothetical protein
MVVAIGVAHYDLAAGHFGETLRYFVAIRAHAKILRDVKRLIGR